MYLTTPLLKPEHTIKRDDHGDAAYVLTESVEYSFNECPDIVRSQIIRSDRPTTNLLEVRNSPYKVRTVSQLREYTQELSEQILEKFSEHVKSADGRGG